MSNIKAISKFVIIFFLFLSNSYSIEKVAFINIDLVIKKSNIGIVMLSKIETLNNQNIKKLKIKQSELKDLEDKIKKKQNIASKDENITFYGKNDDLPPYFNHINHLKMCIRKNGSGVNLQYALRSVNSADHIGILRCGTEACGFVTLKIRSLEHKTIDVAVVCAKTGYGYSMIDATIDFCRKHDFRVITLEAINNNLVNYYNKNFKFISGWKGMENNDWSKLKCGESREEKNGQLLPMHLCL